MTRKKIAMRNTVGTGQLDLVKGKSPVGIAPFN